MKTVKHTLTFYISVFSLALALFVFDSTGILTLNLGTLHPLTLIPLLVAVGLTAREWAGLMLGTLFGVLLDITASGSYFFNLITLAVIGCVCGLLSSYRVNDNIYSALALSLFASISYFSLKWVCFCLIPAHRDVWGYLLKYALPSAIYTALFVIPFYYLIKYISKKTHYII